MRYFKKNPPDATFVPRLSVDSSSIGEALGFLHVSTSVKKIEIGAATGREFRLVQCLFSPQNNLSAPYHPVTQTYERAFNAIGMKADSLNVRLSNSQSADRTMAEIIEKSLQNLREGKIANHFSFVSEGGKVRMEIISKTVLVP